MEEKTIAAILDTVPREKAFYFFTSIGNYTGENASSLREFVDKIGRVDQKSLEFHLYRGDFEKWISLVLKDEELMLEIRKLQRTGFTGESLRNQLYVVVSKHHDDLVRRQTRKSL